MGNYSFDELYGRGPTYDIEYTTATPQGKKMKLSQVADQGDESEFHVVPESPSIQDTWPT